jgi:predicted MFS family arabinose efflux permease
VWTVGFAAFALVTSELFPVGVLSAVSADLGTPTGVTGLMVTVPGVVAAVSAPLVAVHTRGLDSRVALALLVALVGLSNLASAFAANIEAVLVARVAVGIGVGGFWALAAGIAPRLVPQARVPLATAVVFGGVSAASVLGVPATAQLSSVLGWRAGSVTIALVAAGVVVAVIRLVPALPAVPDQVRRRSGTFATAVRRSWLVLVVTTLVVVGHFAVFTFAGPIVQSVSGVAESDLPPVFLAYGLAGMGGNLIAGRFVALSPRRAARTIAVTIAMTLLLLLAVGHDPVPGTGLMLVWGLAFGATSVTLQLWLLQVSGSAAQLATSASVSVFNLAVAAGAALGGIAIDVTGTERSALVVATVLLLLAALAPSISHPGPVNELPACRRQ